jgi:hypothetical protein
VEVVVTARAPGHGRVDKRPAWDRRSAGLSDQPRRGVSHARRAAGQPHGLRVAGGRHADDTVERRHGLLRQQLERTLQPEHPLVVGGWTPKRGVDDVDVARERVERGGDLHLVGHAEHLLDEDRRPAGALLAGGTLGVASTRYRVRDSHA